MISEAPCTNYIEFKEALRKAYERGEKNLLIPNCCQPCLYAWHTMTERRFLEHHGGDGR